MTDCIKIEFGFGQLPAVQFGNQNIFSREIRAGYKSAERVNDAAAAARNHRIGSVAKRGLICIRKVTAAIELVAAKNKHLPSAAMCCIVADHVSRWSAVGAQ